jgi:predicted dehydrogenase
VGGPLRIGVIGVGVISKQYFASFPRLPGLKLVAVADLDLARAKAVAVEQGVAAMSVDELLTSGEVDAVLNLTIPAAHVEVGTRALQAGKHVFAEKPLALSVTEGRPMLDLAARLGLRVGSAPDTVLGTGIQTARQLLDEGVVGQPVSAAAAWSAPGHERWHPAPAFYYQPGGGPLLDMGPYYLTALITLLGPVERVSGAGRQSPRERTIATGPNAGTPLPVSIDTTVTAILEHSGGAISTVSLSFDNWATRAPRPLFELYGTTGTIAVPDPNRFEDPVEVFTAESDEWRTAPPSGGYVGAARGYGLADMARAIETDRPHRASGDLALHVLEIMDAVAASSEAHSSVELTTTVARPEAVPAGATPDTW